MVCQIAMELMVNLRQVECVRVACRGIKEINMYEVDSKKLIFDTIFIGGGTPSLLEPKYIEAILSTLNKKFN